jgi:hypothetical protein
LHLSEPTICHCQKIPAIRLDEFQGVGQALQGRPVRPAGSPAFQIAYGSNCYPRAIREFLLRHSPRFARTAQVATETLVVSHNDGQ